MSEPGDIERIMERSECPQHGPNRLAAVDPTGSFTCLDCGAYAVDKYVPASQLAGAVEALREIADSPLVRHGEMARIAEAALVKLGVSQPSGGR